MLRRHDLRKTAGKDGQDDQAGSQASTHHPAHNDKGDREDQNVGEEVGASDPDQHLAHLVAAHAVQSAKRAWLPRVSRERRADEDVEEPWDQGAADGKDQDGIEDALEPLDDGASPQEETDDGCLDERQDGNVQQIERHYHLHAVSTVAAVRRGSTYGVVLVVVGLNLVRRHLPDVHANMPHLDICVGQSKPISSARGIRTLVGGPYQGD